MCEINLLRGTTKLPDLELKILHKQLLGYFLLDIPILKFLMRFLNGTSEASLRYG